MLWSNVTAGSGWSRWAGTCGLLATPIRFALQCQGPRLPLFVSFPAELAGLASMCEYQPAHLDHMFKTDLGAMAKRT